MFPEEDKKVHSPSSPGKALALDLRSTGKRVMVSPACPAEATGGAQFSGLPCRSPPCLSRFLPRTQPLSYWQAVCRIQGLSPSTCETSMGTSWLIWFSTPRGPSLSPICLPLLTNLGTLGLPKLPALDVPHQYLVPCTWTMLCLLFCCGHSEGQHLFTRVP